MAVELNRLLQLVVEKGASDLHLTVGIPPAVRLHGGLRPLNVPPLEPTDTVNFMKSITPERLQEELKQKGGCDFGFAFENKARFRVAVFQQRGNIGIVLRLIPSKILTFDQIGIPAKVRDLLDRPRGMVLVTGPTGCGKTTTLATMIDTINNEMDCHIITIEDPIEYYHTHKKSIMTQREIGVDVGNFAEALRRALRMDPDVILVGEMRDLETISSAITAAETGHLVFGTLHTTGAAQTVNRIIDAFPVEQQEQIRAQLSSALLAVISQALLPRADASGVVAAYEYMTVTPAIANLIRDNQSHKISSYIQAGGMHGMVLLDDFLHDLFKKKKISRETMMSAAQKPEDLEDKMKAEAMARLAPNKR